MFNHKLCCFALGMPLFFRSSKNYFSLFFLKLLVTDINMFKYLNIYHILDWPFA